MPPGTERCGILDLSIAAVTIDKVLPFFFHILLLAQRIGYSLFITFHLRILLFILLSSSCFFLILIVLFDDCPYSSGQIIVPVFRESQSINQSGYLTDGIRQ